MKPEKMFKEVKIMQICDLCFAEIKGSKVQPNNGKPIDDCTKCLTRILKKHSTLPVNEVELAKDLVKFQAEREKNLKLLIEKLKSECKESSV